MGIIIGALAGGICFVALGLMRAGHAGGLLIIYLLNRLKSRAAGQPPFVRIMIAAGIILGIVLGLTASMVLGGIVGGILEHMLMTMN